MQSVISWRSLHSAFGRFGVNTTTRPPSEVTYGALNESQIKGGLTSDEIQKANQLYIDLLKDFSVNAETLPITIIRALGRGITYEPLLAYVQQKYNTESPSQHASRIAHFGKIYNCINRFVETGEWPPPNYPSTSTPVYRIVGYKSEKMIEADVRCITGLMDNAKDKNSASSLTLFIDKMKDAFLEQIRELHTNHDNAITINTILSNTLKTIINDTNPVFNIVDFDKRYYKEDTLDEHTLTVLQKGQGVQRLFYYFKTKSNASSLDFLLDKANTSEYSEFTIGFVQPSIVQNIILTQRLEDRNQMHFIFFPSCGPVTNFNKHRTIFMIDPSEPLTLNDIDWIQFDYDFPETDLCDKYHLNGDSFNTVGVFQGYHAESFPHPAFLIAMSHGILGAHDHVKELWPEWFDDVERSRWVEKTLAKWRYDISTMPVTTLYERNMKEVQELFYNYALSKIPTMAAEKQLGKKPGFMIKEQLHTLYANLPTESGLPAMLSRVNMNANRNANAAFQRFNRNVRPFLKTPIPATLKARKRGFFTSESKNSYRRTLKKNIYDLMKATGAKFTPADAVAELPYIVELAYDTKISDRVVYERMKDWVERYVTVKYPVREGSVTPNLRALDGIANLFINLTPSSKRKDLQLAASIAASIQNGGQTLTPVTPLLFELNALKNISKDILSASELYRQYTLILKKYAAVIATLPAEVARQLSSVSEPPKQGFFARLSGSYNTAAWGKVYGQLLDAIRALSVIPTAEKMGPSSEVPTLADAMTPAKEPVTFTTTLYKVIPTAGGAAGGNPRYWAVARDSTGKVLSKKEILEANLAAPVTSNATRNQAVSEAYSNVKTPIQEVTEEQFAQIGGSSRRMARRTRTRTRTRRTRKQHGGAATSMPLAWYQQGAQFQGTVAETTGVGLAGSSAAWARSALPAQGGGRRTRRGQRAGVTDHLEQMGGFSPSVMGAGFAEVGMRLLPAAAYMGYNQFQNFSKQRKRTHRRQRK